MEEGRIREHWSFSLPELIGLRIEAIFGVVDLEDPDTQPILVNLKLSDGMWHRFFLNPGSELGYATWQTSARCADDDPEGDGVRHVDYGDAYQLVGESLQRVEANSLGEQDASQLTILLASGRAILLAFSSPMDPESAVHFTVRGLPT